MKQNSIARRKINKLLRIEISKDKLEQPVWPVVFWVHSHSCVQIQLNSNSAYPPPHPTNCIFEHSAMIQSIWDISTCIHICIHISICICPYFEVHNCFLYYILYVFCTAFCIWFWTAKIVIILFQRINGIWEEGILLWCEINVSGFLGEGEILKGVRIITEIEQPCPLKDSVHAMDFHLFQNK